MNMKNSQVQFKIQNLRAKSLLETMEALLVSVAAFMVMAILPSLLIRYLYESANLFEQPKTLEYIPVLAFSVSIFYIVKALFFNMRRAGQIKILEMELEATDDSCESCQGEDEAEDEDWEKELAELEALLDEDDKKTDGKSAKKASKKSLKKSAKKKSK